MIKVIYEDNHLLVVVKPINMPTQEDNSKDLDLLNALKKYIKEKYNKPGNVYLGLVHRLDRPVGGVMVFAKTSKAASRLNEQIKNNLVKKTYYAVICGNLSGKGSFEDYLIKDEKKNISYVSDKGKYSKLNYEVIGNKDNKTLVKINLITGRSHQIRVQFSSRDYPLYGDMKYNKRAKLNEQLALFSKELEFIHPVTKEVMKFNVDLPNAYPFNLFS